MKSFNQSVADEIAKAQPGSGAASGSARCVHPRKTIVALGGNPYMSLRGTDKPRTPQNFREGQLKFATWYWCSACGALGSLNSRNDLMWQVPTSSERNQLQQQVRQLKHDIESYRGALGYSVSGTHNGKLSNGETPQCGLCNSEYRRELEQDKCRLDWLIRNMSGKEARELGMEYSDGLRREHIDAAMKGQTK